MNRTGTVIAWTTMATCVTDAQPLDRAKAVRTLTALDRNIATTRWRRTGTASSLRSDVHDSPTRADLAPMQEIAFIAFVDETIKPSLQFRPPNPEKFPLIALTR